MVVDYPPGKIEDFFLGGALGKVTVYLLGATVSSLMGKVKVCVLDEALGKIEG